MLLRNYRFDFFPQSFNRKLYTSIGAFECKGILLWSLHENLGCPKFLKEAFNIDFYRFPNLFSP